MTNLYVSSQKNFSWKVTSLQKFSFIGKWRIQRIFLSILDLATNYFLFVTESGVFECFDEVFSAWLPITVDSAGTQNNASRNTHSKKLIAPAVVW